MERPVLELDGVSYLYPGASTPALRQVTLSVAPGELVVLAGISGSGKSTLLRVANGLVPHFHGGVFSGRAEVGGMSTREHGPGELAATVGTLFQDPETQVVMGSVRAELALPLENRGLPAAALATGVEEAALALGIAHLLERPIAELSGGELQRVALGAALVTRPQLLLLDEPTSQLDPVAGDELLGLLRRLNHDGDTAIVLAEHRLERCLSLCDRVIALKAGTVACDAPPAEFLRWALDTAPELCTPGAAMLDAVGLDPVPGVRAARAQLRRRGMLPDRRAPAEETAAQEARAPARSARRRNYALRLDRVWHELRSGPAILRAVSLEVAPGERVALMGRNGAGKSTLLRHAGGLMAPTRGSVTAAGRVALLLQNPTDYLVADSVSDEAPAPALAAAGLDPEALGARHPREISVGEKQRLALAVVLGHEPGNDPAVVCLDEPTRGLDRALKAQLAGWLAEQTCAVIVATHDPEFAAAFAERVVLLADGTVIADGSAREVLAGGLYFATETARILGGEGGVLTAAEGARLLIDRARTAEGVR